MEKKLWEAELYYMDYGVKEKPTLWKNLVKATWRQVKNKITAKFSLALKKKKKKENGRSGLVVSVERWGCGFAGKHYLIIIIFLKFNKQQPVCVEI